MKFRDLVIGQTFDFVADGGRYNSFFQPCRKVSARKYQYPTGKPKPFHFYLSQVGSIDAEVFHVGIEYPEPPLSDAQ